jgi:hypothetical protein
MADEQHKGEPEAPKTDAPAGTEPPKPSEALKQGFRLLWQAASSAADEIKREVQKGGVSQALQNAGRELESAATHAAKAIEEIFAKVGPAAPTYEKKWPPGSTTEQVDADVPADGGVDEKGDRRDMRIQVDGDEKKKP